MLEDLIELDIGRMYFNRAKTCSNLMLYMAQDLLDFSLLQSDSLALQSSHFSAEQVLEDSISLFKQLAKDKRIWLYYNYDSCLPEKIRTDQKRFQKILIKILSVSIKYTERGHIKVSA